MELGNRFLRKSLIAQMGADPDPQGLAEIWASFIEDFLEGVWPEGKALAHYDLMANIGKILRTRQSSWPPYIQDVMARGTKYLSDHAEECISDASEIPNIEAWTKQLEALPAALEDEELGADQRMDLACRIVADLDDAQVVCAVSSNYGVFFKSLVEELEIAEERLLSSSVPLLDPAFFIQNIAAGIDTDLFENHPPLASTATKFAKMLDAIENALSESIAIRDPSVARFKFRTWVMHRQHQPTMRLAAADDRPSASLMREIERLDIPSELPGVGQVFVSRRLFEDWILEIQILDRKGEYLKIDAIQIGDWPGKCDNSTGMGSWTVSLGLLRADERKRALTSPPIVSIQSQVPFKLTI